MKFRLKKFRTQSGQTLIFGIISVIIILIAILLLFDLHTVIRGKIKSQTAVDAAALAGANWQLNSLNLIGELNLVKACSVLISDIVYGIGTDPETFTKVKNYNEYESSVAFEQDIRRVEDEFESLDRTIALLTQMQTRISFVGPLIGYGAAQQAAKNNGLNANPDAGEMDLEMYYNIMDDNIYGQASIPQVINGYEWRMPYAGMLERIIDVRFSTGGGAPEAKGIAVGTKVLRIGTPNIYTDPPSYPDFTSFLMNKRMYAAIHAEYWCELRDVLRMEFGNRWWGDIRLGNNSSFIGASEILPLHISFFTGSMPYNMADESDALDLLMSAGGRQESSKIGDLFDSEDPYYNDKTKDENGEFHITVRTDASGNPVRNPDDQDFRFNILPMMRWATYDWQWYSYDQDMQNDWADNWLRKDFKEGYNYMSGALAYFQASQATATITSSLGNPNYRSGSLSDALENEGTKRYTDRFTAAENKMQSGLPDIQVDALAKPFGKITVEGKDMPPFVAGIVLPVFSETALIPVSLEHVYGMSSIDIDWYLFVTKFLPALGMSDSIASAQAKLDAKTRARTASYVSALAKLNDPAWRQKGINWLDETTTDPTGKKVTNEENCDYWTSGGGGPRKDGPGKLH